MIVFKSLINGSLLDPVGGNNGTLTAGVSRGFVQTDKGLALECDGANTKVVYGDIENIKSIGLWINLDTTTEQILEGSANAKLIHANSGTLTYADFDNAYIDNVDTNTITIGWHCIVITSTTNVDMSAVTLALNNASYGKFQCARIQFWDDDISVKTRNDFYRDFLNAGQTSPQKRGFTVQKPTDLSRYVDDTVGDNLIPSGIDRTWGTDVATEGTPYTNFQGAYTWVAYGSPTSLTVANNVLSIVAGGSSKGVKINSMAPQTGVRVTLTLNITAITGSWLYRCYDRTGGVWLDSITITTTGLKVLSFIAPSSNLEPTLTSSGSDTISIDAGSSENSFYPHSGLVAAYNMTLVNGQVIDLTGNGNDGTVTNSPPTSNGLDFNGIDGKIAIGNLGNIKSMAFRVKLDSTTEKILEGAANDKLIHVSSGTLTYPEFDNAFVDGIDTNTVSINGFVDIVIVSSTNVDMSAVTVALNNATYGDFEIEDLKFYSTQLTAQEAKDYHNSFILPTLVETFDEGADGIAKLPTDWHKGTGTYKIDQWNVGQSQAYNNDLSSGNGGFANEVRATRATGSTVGGESCLKLTCDGSASTTHYMVNQDSTDIMTKGKRYKINVNIYVPSGNSVVDGAGFAIDGNKNGTFNVYLSEVDIFTPTQDQWTAIEIKDVFTDLSDSRDIVVIMTDGSAISLSGNSSDYIAVKDLVISEIEYENDGSGIYYEPIKHGDKYLENTVAGTIATLSGQAYGTYEGDIYKGADGNQPVIKFISPDNSVWSGGGGNDYALILGSDEKVYFYKNDTGSILFITSASYINNNQWYHIKITRAKAGVFTVWIDGVLVVVVTGTNPVTDTTYSTSVFTVLDLDAGDRVANFTYKDEIQQ